MYLKPCGKCGKLIPYGLAYCDKCQEVHDQEASTRAKESKRVRDREYNAKRDVKYKRFYNTKEWRTLSRLRMQKDHYRCQWCGKVLGSHRDDDSIVVLEVDHIQELSTPEGWRRRYDMENLRTLCSYCHNERHGRFQKRSKP
jgi:5-methylcytosine-specific restriction endonuclease McrA